MFVGLHADLRIEMFVVVTRFYTLDGMKSILLHKFGFFRSRLRLSLKNTNLLFYCFYYLFYKCCTSYYNIPTSLYTREPLAVVVCLSDIVLQKLSFRTQSLCAAFLCHLGYEHRFIKQRHFNVREILSHHAYIEVSDRRCR